MAEESWGKGRGTAAMLARLTARMTIQEVVDLASRRMENPVILYTTDGRRVYFSGACGGHVGAELSMLITNMTDPNAFDIAAARKRVRRVPTETDGVWVDEYGEGVPRALVSELTVAGHQFALLLAVEQARPFDEGDHSALQLLRDAIAPKLAELCVAQDVEGSFSQAEREGDINAGTQWLRKLGGHLFQNFRVVAADISGVPLQHFDGLYADMKRSLRRGRLVRLDRLAVAICNLQDEEEYRELLSGLNATISRYAAPMGVSGRFSRTEELHDRYLQANSVLRAGRALYGVPGLFEFDQMAEYALLNDISDTADLEKYCSHSLEELHRVDIENSTEYLRTLKEYLSCGCSKKRTGERLNIHRNTLAYRLDRIEEIVGRIDDSGESRLRLWLSLKLLNLRDTTGA